MHLEAIIGNRELTVPLRDIPDYHADVMEVACLDDLSDEYKELRADLRQFLKVNKKHWSLSTLARFLNTDTLTLSKLLPYSELQGFNQNKAQTILVLKPKASMETDNLLYKAHKL